MRGKLLKILCGILAALSISVAVSAAVPQEAEAVWVSHGDRVYYGGYYTTYFWADGQTAYCMQPPKATPRNANYSQYYWRNAPNIFYGALYFGPGGPGFEWAKSQGWWPSTNYRGGWMSYGDYYAATHVLLAQSYGQNALYGTSNSYRWWANTYILGHLAWCINNYSYMIPQQFKNNCFYCPTGSRYQDIAGSYWVNSGGISIHKEEYGTRQAMTGIRFDIYNSDQWGNIGGWVTSITTNSAGNASTLANQLPLGYYMAVEANTPAGYAQARKHIYVGSHFNYASVTIQNREYTTASVNKKFIGSAENVTLDLMQNGRVYSSVQTGGKQAFSYTWRNLPKRDELGRAYMYTVREHNAVGDLLDIGTRRYVVSQMGNNITNIEAVDKISVQKEWDDEDNKFGQRPDEITVSLVQKTSNYQYTYGQKTITAADGWKTEWTHLPMYDAAGNKYEYSVIESNPNLLTTNTYKCSVAKTAIDDHNLAFTLSNSLRTTDVVIKKKWIGSNEKPESIMFAVTGSDGSSYELSMPVVGASQQASTELPKGDKDGNLITYDVNEISLDGWVSSKARAGHTFNFTNVSTENYNIPVEKKWNSDAGVPSSLEVSLKTKVPADSLSDGYAAVYKYTGSTSYGYPYILVFGKGEVPQYYHTYYQLVDGAAYTNIEKSKPFDSELPPWNAAGGQEFSGKISKVFYDTTLIGKTLSPKNTSHWFDGLATDSLDLSFLDTSKAIDMTGMFDNMSVDRLVLPATFKFSGNNLSDVKKAKLPNITWYGHDGTTYTASAVQDDYSDMRQADKSFFSCPMGNLYAIVSNSTLRSYTDRGDWSTKYEQYYRIDFMRRSSAPVVGQPAYINSSNTTEKILWFKKIDEADPNFQLNVPEPYATDYNSHIDTVSIWDKIYPANIDAWFRGMPVPLGALDLNMSFNEDNGSTTYKSSTEFLGQSRTSSLLNLHLDECVSAKSAFDYLKPDIWGDDQVVVSISQFLYKANVQKLVNASSMFESSYIVNSNIDATELTSMWNLWNLSNASNMFKYFSPTVIDLSHAYLKSLKDASGMFYSSNARITIPSLPTGTSVSDMFHYVSNPPTITYKDYSADDSSGTSDLETDADGNVIVTVQTKTLSADTGWKTSFDDVPRFDESGMVEYFVEESPVDGWTPTVKGNQNTGFTITNNTAFPVKFKKIWNGADFSGLASKYRSDITDGVTARVKAIRKDGTSDNYDVKLTGTMNETGTTTWETTAQIPTADASGIEYVDYEVSELDDLSVLVSPSNPTDVANFHYASSISGSVKGGEVVLTNTLFDDSVTRLHISKQWVDTTGEGVPYDVTAKIMKRTFKRSDASPPMGGSYDPQYPRDSYVMQPNTWTYDSILYIKTELTDEMRAAVDPGESVTLSLCISGMGEMVNYRLSPAEYGSPFVVPVPDMGGVYLRIRVGSDVFYTVKHVVYYSTHETVDDEVYSTVQLTEANGYSQTLNGLPYTKDGKAVGDADEFYFYYVVEDETGSVQPSGKYVSDIQSSRSVLQYNAVKTDIPATMFGTLHGTSAQFDYNMTNTFVKDMIDIPVEKIWDDNDDELFMRPSSLDVNLVKGRSNTVVQTITLTEDGGWKGSFTGLPTYENGAMVDYRVKEPNVPEGYTLSKTIGSAARGFELTDSLAKYSVNVQKTWDDFDNAGGTRPESVTVELLRDGEETGYSLSLGEANGWAAGFADLPMYKSNGMPYDYTVRELPVEGYDASISYTSSGTSKTATVTNKLSDVSISVDKTWKTIRGSHPDTATVRLLANGSPYAAEGYEPTAVLSDANGWSHTFAGLPALDDAHAKISYTVEEVMSTELAESYTCSVSGSATAGFHVLNTEKFSIPVYKVWSDYDDADKIRPESVTIDLVEVSSGKIVDTMDLTKDGEWKGEFQDVPTTASDGSSADYTVSEHAVPEYAVSVSGNAVNGFTVTNAHQISYTDVPVRKVWFDSGDQDKVRPASITLHLLADGADTGRSLVLSAGDDGTWDEENLSGTFEHLPIYNDDNKMVSYTVTEDPIPDADGNELYERSTSTASDGSIVVTNFREPETVDISVEKVWEYYPSEAAPISVKMHLVRNGERVAEAMTEKTDVEDLWSCRFDHQPINDENGVPYKYTVEEDEDSLKEAISKSNLSAEFKAVAKFHSVVSTTADEWSADLPKITVFNRFMLLSPVYDGDFPTYLDGLAEPTTVTKQWVGDAEEDRPASIRVHLLANGEEAEGFEPVELTAENGWKYSFGALVPYDADGNEISYSVREEPVDGYTTEYSIDPASSTSFIVTNTLIGHVDVEKEWVDGNDSSHIRPGSVSVRLVGHRYANAKNLLYEVPEGSSTGRWAFSLSAGTDFEGTAYLDSGTDFSNGLYACLYDGAGKLVRKVLLDLSKSSDVEIDGVPFVLGDVSDEAGYITFEDAAGSPYDSSQVLRVIVHDQSTYVDEGSEQIAELTEANGWKHRFEDVNLVDALGLPIAFEIIEQDYFGYASKVTQTSPTSFKVVNTLEDKIHVEKRWMGATSSADGTRFDVEAELLCDGNPTGKTIMLTAENGYAADFEGIEWADADGKRHEYSVRESNATPSWIASVDTSRLETDATIVMTNVEAGSLRVKKTWFGDEGVEGARPDSISYDVIQKATGRYKLSALSASDTTVSPSAHRIAWTSGLEGRLSSFENEYAAPKSVSISLQNVTGAALAMKVSKGSSSKVVEIPAGASSVSLSEIAKADGVWSFEPISENDASLDEAIASGKLAGEIMFSTEKSFASRELSASPAQEGSDPWSDLVEGFPLTDVDGTALSYAVSETSVPEGYSSSVEPMPADESGSATYGYVISNTYDMTSLSVEKVWKDADDADGLRPASVEVELLSDGEPTGKVLILSEENGWRSSFAHLSKTSSDGKAVEYSVRENDVPAGYEATISVEGGTAVVENVHNVLVDVPVQKTWDDMSNFAKTRPEQLDVSLVANEGTPSEKVAARVQLSGSLSASEWSYVFFDLPYADEDGNVISYTVREDMPEGYAQSSLTGNQSAGFSFTNRYTLFPVEMPFSGQAGIAALLAAGAVLAAIGAVLVARSRNKKEE